MERHRGRPKAIEAKQQYTVMLKPSVVKEVDEFAEKLEMTRSQFLSNLIEIGLDDVKLFNKSGFLWVVKSGVKAARKLKEAFYKGKLGFLKEKGEESE